MTVDQLKFAVLELDPAARQEFILSLLPELGSDVIKDPAFLSRLLPALLGLLRESGLDLGQLLQFANQYAANSKPAAD